jgi:MGT family glycosyltransferase
MAHFGMFSFSGAGHLNPMTTLGRHLKRRGHRVTYFQVVDEEATILRSGLEFHPIGEVDFPQGTLRRLGEQTSRLSGWEGVQSIVRRSQDVASMVLRDGPGAVRSAQIDALLVDQLEFAAGSVAESLGIPFLNIAVLPPINRDEFAPPVTRPWIPSDTPAWRAQLRAYREMVDRLHAPLIGTVNEGRRKLGLAGDATVRDDLFSTRAQITQLPEVLDFPRVNRPAQLFYAGPFHDDERVEVEFPWERLDGRPLLYASMGTVLHSFEHAYRVIAEAAVGLDVQVVISLGGGYDPAQFTDLPGDPIVVAYAPQMALLKRASVAVTHGGINTVLEVAAHGIPMVVIPVTFDQPGNAARIGWRGTGVVVPFEELSTARLHAALRELEAPAYREAASWLRDEIRECDGLGRAVARIEAAIAGAAQRQSLG